MKLIHYVATDYASGGTGGIPHFDYQLKKVFPQMETWAVKKYGKFFDRGGKQLVITCNDECLDVPEHIPCISVHHGCAYTHWEREPNWSAGHHFTSRQNLMKSRLNTHFVSISKFMTQEFKKHHDIDCFATILHAVETKPFDPTKVGIKGRNVIVDARNFNKGKEIVDKLKAANHFNIMDLSCGKYNKAEGYKNGNIYLCLSLSEGNSYSVMDALACGLPVLSTDVGLFGGDYHQDMGECMAWETREDIDLIHSKLEYMYSRYEKYKPIDYINATMPFDGWVKRWERLVQNVAKLYH